MVNIFSTPRNSFSSPITLNGTDIVLSDPSYLASHMLTVTGSGRIISSARPSVSGGVGEESTLVLRDVDGNLEVTNIEIPVTELYLGLDAGRDRTSVENVGLGHLALSDQASSTSQFSTAVGSFAGRDNLEFSTGSTTLGYAAGQQSGEGNVSLGWESGFAAGDYSINVGYQTGNTCDGGSTNVGRQAGRTTCAARCTNIGYQAGNTNTNDNSTNIGALAGFTNTNDNDNTIILNGSGVALQSSEDNALYSSECRVDDTATNSMMSYNSTTKEITNSDTLNSAEIINGSNHTHTSSSATNSILSGFTNQILNTSAQCTIVGGVQNVIDSNSERSTILGGFSNTITGALNSASFGCCSTITHDGCLVLTDGDVGKTPSSGMNNQCIIRFEEIKISAPDIITSGLITPVNTDTDDIGSTSKRYDNIHANKLFIDDIEVSNDILPTTTRTSDLGNESLLFRNVRSEKLFLRTDNGASIDIQNINAVATTRFINGQSDFGGGGLVTTFHIDNNGTMCNNTGQYNTCSDVRIKENIIDSPDHLENLLSIQVRKYNLISDPTTDYIGMIAQELEVTHPSMVNYDETDDMYSIKTSHFVPYLIKCIQEQSALITALTERVSALEA